MKRDLVTTYSSKTQANGRITVDVSAYRSWEYHQFQVEINAETTPSAGTLYIDGRTPGASEYQNIGTIDMTGTYLVAVSSGVCFDSIRIRPVSFDSDKSYNLIIYSKVK